MPPKGKGKSRKGRKKRFTPFPNVPLREIVNPFGDPVRSRRARQGVFRRLVKNKPKESLGTFETLNKKAGPTLADTEDLLFETYESVYHPVTLPKGAKPAPGLEWDTGKKVSLIEGGRLNQLSVKELHQIAINISKQKQKETVTAGIASTEKDFLIQQLALLESQLTARRAAIDRMEREKAEQIQTVRHANKVYGEKIKYTMSEQHEGLCEKRLEHLDLHVKKQQRYWKIEKDKYEKLQTKTEEAEYENFMLDLVCREIEMAGTLQRQVVKEDYQVCLQTLHDNFDRYMTDTQDDVEILTKAHAKAVDALRHKNITSLLQYQEKSISEMRKFFQGINTANSSIVHQLKNDVHAKRLKLDRLERDLVSSLEEHARVMIPLQNTMADIRKFEEILQDADRVKDLHTKAWHLAKTLEETVLRLRWQHEIEEVKREKAQELLGNLQTAYLQTSLDVARKAGVSQLINHRLYSTLAVEAEMHRISVLMMEPCAESDPETVVQREARIQQFFEHQESEIKRLKLQGLLLKQKYDHLRSQIEVSFEKQCRSPFATTGVRFARLEEPLVNCLPLLKGISDDEILQWTRNDSVSHAAKCAA